MPTIEEAIALAAMAHRGQVDKVGAPYIFHPIRVMLRLDTEWERMTAILHDVVEDTEWTLESLREKGFPPPVVEAVDLLSRRPGESYEDFILRLKPNDLARRVKLADLEDNMDLGRLPSITPKDRDRLQRYTRAKAELEAVERTRSAIP